jgi:hypothetical protein
MAPARDKNALRRGLNISLVPCCDYRLMMHADFLNSSVSVEHSSLVQSLVETLSNIDFEHRLEIQRLQASRTSPEIKSLLVGKCRERHRERRAPYVRELSRLHQRRMQRSAPPHGAS